MILYFDFETSFGKHNNLQSMTPRRYLQHPDTRVLLVGFAVDDGPVEAAQPDTPEWDRFCQLWREADVVVAHNASFDVRVATIACHLPWPRRVHCTKELAGAWTPNQPGGYSLKNLSYVWLGEDMQKLTIDFNSCTTEELITYCRQDVECCRALHRLAMQRLTPEELAVCEMTNACKEIVFQVDRQRVVESFDAFVALANQHATSAEAILETEGGESPFNRDGDRVRSVRPQVLKQQLLLDFGFEVESITLKKINPAKLAQAPEASAILRHTAEANKALSHRRRVNTYRELTEIDVELTYGAAHTGRFSSKNQGTKGLNLHNLPKRNPLVAKPIRQMFSLPDDLMFVRADFANVEYRLLGWLSRSPYVTQMFENDVDADPYCAFWFAATGQRIDKKHPARQIAKAAVLGLGFSMGLMRWMNELLLALADPTFGVTLADMEAVCQSQGWRAPTKNRVFSNARTKTRAPDAVAIVAYHTRELFHQIHPEFGRLARWLNETVTRVAAAAPENYERTLDLMYEHPSAPDRRRVDLRVDTDMQGLSVRARVGNWSYPMVTWRDLGVREIPKRGIGLSSVQAGNKGYRLISPAILIENITQEVARHALVAGMLHLRRQYPYIPSVHDEVMLVTRRDSACALAAREALCATFNPAGPLGYEWAVYAKRGDVTMSRTLYEDEALSRRQWAALEAGDSSVLEHLS